MSRWRARRATSGPHEDADRRRPLLLWVALATAVAVTILSGPALAQDATPPTFDNATAVNETAFEVVVEDEGDVDESSITADDFALNRGTLGGIGVSERGNDSAVTVHLERRIPQNTVTLSVADDGEITDDAGNNMTEGSVTVTGMDGYDPYLEEYELNRLSESTVQIEFYTDEPIHNASVAVYGPERETLGPSAFTETDTRASHEYRYHANYTFGADGEYEFSLLWIEDRNENRAVYHADRTAVHDTTTPQARIDGPASATLGQTVSFDANQSSDDRAVESYEWAVDGNVTGTNETFTHAFNASGRHEVELTVADDRNNTDTAVTTVEVLDVSTTEDVAISPTNGTGVDVTVGPNRSEGRVLVERSGSLARNGSVSLDSLTMSIPPNGTANLSTAADGIPAGFAEREQIGFGTFDVTHEGADVSDVTFRFTVNRTVIETANVSADGIGLFRETGEGWTRLPALRVGGNETHLEYRATSPGLSRFVVAASNATGEGISDGDGAGPTGDESTDDDRQVAAGDEPVFAVVDATLLAHNVSAGDPIVARATVANEGNVSGTYVAGLSVDGTVVGTSEVTVPAGERREVTVAEPIESGGAVALNDSQLGAVTVGGGAVGTDGIGGGFSIPNPLTLWPGGLFGRALGAMFWLVVAVYAILKSLAIYLGY